MFEFRRWSRGYVRVRLSGMYPERFVNICNSRNIELRRLVYYNNRYNCNISLDDYRRLRPAVRKSGVVPYINSRHGLPFLLQGMWKRKSLVIGLALSCIIFFALSCYIWRVDVEGNYRHSTEQLMKFISGLDIGVGTRIADIDAQSLESKIRQEYPDIGWVSVQIRGTWMNISIKEINTTYETLGSRENKYEAAHIAATRDGIVTEIITRSGVPLVKEGDVVRKGQRLVDGVVTVVGDNETPVGKKPVLADADIRLKSYIPVRISISRSYTYKEYTGKKKSGYNFFLFDDKIFSYNSGIPYVKCDIISEVKNFELFKNFYLPLKYEQFSVLEYNEVDKQYSDEELEALLEQRLERACRELENDGCGIIDVSVDKTLKKDGLTASGRITVDAAFVKYVEVSEDEWRIDSADEHNGDSD